MISSKSSLSFELMTFSFYFKIHLRVSPIKIAAMSVMHHWPVVSKSARQEHFLSLPFRGPKWEHRDSSCSCYIELVCSIQISFYELNCSVATDEGICIEVFVLIDLLDSLVSKPWWTYLTKPLGIPISFINSFNK